jgi:hypothetical protein
MEGECGVGTDVVAVAGPADRDELADFDVRGDGIEGDGCGGEDAEEGEEDGWEGEFHCCGMVGGCCRIRGLSSGNGVYCNVSIRCSSY